MTFESDIKKAEKLIINASVEVIRGTALAMFGEIIRKTPVGKRELWNINQGKTAGSLVPKGYVGGRLRNNWQATINTPATGAGNDADQSGGAANGSVKAAVAAYDLNKALFLTNNLPYAQRVEDGWSKQRPEGMVKTTVTAFKAEIDKLAGQKKI